MGFETPRSANFNGGSWAWGRGEMDKPKAAKIPNSYSGGKETRKLPFLLSHYTVTICVCVLITPSCPTLRDPMDCSPPASSVHGILQARTLEWVAISFSVSLYARPSANMSKQLGRLPRESQMPHLISHWFP